MNWPNPTAKSAFLAGLWTGAIQISTIFVESYDVDLSKSHYFLFSVVALVPVYPYVVGLNSRVGRRFSLPTAEGFAEIIPIMKRFLFWIMGACVIYLLLWIVAILTTLAD